MPLISSPNATLRKRRQPGEQRRLLEHDAAIKAWLFDALAPKPNLTFNRLHQAGHDPQKRTLAAAGRAENAEKLVARDRNLEIPQGLDPAILTFICMADAAAPR